MWQVIQHRWIRDSKHGNVENVVWEGGRHKEALGQAKSNLQSHMEMMAKHTLFFDYWETVLVDWEEKSLTLFDGEEPIYKIRYEVRENG